MPICWQMLLEFYARVVGDTGVRKSKAYCKSWLLDKSNGKVHWRAFWCVFCTNFVKIIPFGFLLWKALQVIIFDAVESSIRWTTYTNESSYLWSIQSFQFVFSQWMWMKSSNPIHSSRSRGLWLFHWKIVFVDKLKNVFPICTWWSPSPAKPSIFFVIFCFIRLIWVLRP